MNQIALNANNPAATMSSREIAELIGKRHPDVKRDVEKMLFGLKEDVSNYARIYLDSMNRQQTEYHLDRDHVDCLLTGYSAELRMRVIQRWRELESQPRELTRMELLQLAIDSEQQRLELAGKLALAAPKAAFVDQYVQAEGSMTFRQVAKILNANERILRDVLVAEGAIYYLNGAMTPCQPHILAGRFEVKTGTSDRNNHVFAQTRFTPKGVQWVAGLWAKSMMQEAV